MPDHQLLNHLTKQTRADADLIYTAARLLNRKKASVTLREVMAPILEGFKQARQRHNQSTSTSQENGAEI